MGAAKLSRAVLWPLETALRNAIAASTSATDGLIDLEGQRLRVHVLGMPFAVDVVVRDTAPRLEPAAACPCTASVVGPPLSMARLARAGTAAAAQGSGVTLTGDLALVERWHAVLRLARPSGEQLLADWIGDVPAHAMSRMAVELRRWGGHALRSLRLNVAEYLQEEGRQLPAPLEAEALFEDIERLRDDVERASRRLDFLQASKR